MSISHYDDTIDSRAVIDRLAELQSERDTLTAALTAAVADTTAPLFAAEDAADATAALTEWNDENADELTALVAFCAEGESLANWRDGVTLVRDSYFVQYAQDYAADTTDRDTDRWPLCHIDWDAAADSLQQDFTAIDFDGVTYWGQ